jgi:hypothetical protein
MPWPEGRHDDLFSRPWRAAPPRTRQASWPQDLPSFSGFPFAGVRGWLVLRLDGDPDWHEVELLCEYA